MNDEIVDKAFGFSRSQTLAYSLDNYSRPDKWYYVGYELQFRYNIHFHRTVKKEDRTGFLGVLLDAFKSSFGLVKDAHFQLEESGSKISEYLMKVLWDKGRLDLRMLNRLEDEINNVAILNRATVELVSLIIIPRSKETIALKIKGQ